MSTLNGVDSLMQRIAEEYEALPRQLQKVARYLEQHRSDLVVQRINEIADGCQVHPSAIVRFAQRFGYSGFTEMQAVFRHVYSEQNAPVRSYQQRIRRVIDSDAPAISTADIGLRYIDASRVGLDELAADFDAERFGHAVQLLVQAENIYIVAVRRSFSVASYVAYALRHTAKRVHLIDGLGGMYREQVRSIGKNDVLIAISFPPYGKESLYCSRVAHQHKAKVLAITESELGPLARDASVLLKVHEGGAFGFRALAATMCLCQALFVAMAYELELKVEETTYRGSYDD
ncbi:MurR/RpiR family transcriptional regulator [Frateuria aurantia]